MKKVVIVVALVPLFVLGCFEGPVTEPTETPLEATSPANVLKIVVKSFNQRDAGLLKAALSPDFVFYFDPRDIGQRPSGSQYVIPESWSYDEFRGAAKNMYDQAYSINFSITTNTVGEPGSSETEYKADNVKISLLVMVTELNGFIADGGYCNFKFERYEAEESRKYWRLTEWWDRTGESFTSLGKVLAVFH